MEAEAIAHFPIAAEPLVSATAHALAQGGDASHEDAAPLTLLTADSGGDAMITARMSPRCGARTGEPLRIVLDAERIHFFDPEPEASIW